MGVGLRLLVLSAALLAALASSCSGAKHEPDAGPKTCTPPSKPPPFKDLPCSNGCDALVLRRLVWPDSTMAVTVGVDFTGDGSVDNTLGSIAGVITEIFDYCPEGELPVVRGKALNLLWLKPAALTGTGPARLQLFQAEPRDCCSTLDYKQCLTEAQTTCFGGAQTFSVDAKVNRYPPMQGTVSNGEVRLRADALLLRLAIPCSTVATADLVVKQARVVARWEKGVLKGWIAGAVAREEISCYLVPKIATSLTAALNLPGVDYDTKEVIRTLFDVDADDQITSAELEGNALFTTFLNGDVDVDHDGEKELSVGLTFEAVGAVFKP